MAHILTLNSNYNLRQSRECSYDVRAFEFGLFPLSMISGVFCDYYCGYSSKHYIFKKIILMVNCPFKRGQSEIYLEGIYKKSSHRINLLHVQKFYR